METLWQYTIGQKIPHDWQKSGMLRLSLNDKAQQLNDDDDDDHHHHHHDNDDGCINHTIASMHMYLCDM